MQISYNYLICVFPLTKQHDFSILFHDSFKCGYTFNKNSQSNTHNMDILFCFLLGLASYCCIAESADSGTTDGTIKEQLTEMNKVNLEIVKLLNAVSQNVQSTEAALMRKFGELENRILNEVAGKQVYISKNSDVNGDNTETVGKILDGKTENQGVGLANTLETIKQTLLEIKRSTTLLTVTWIKKTDLPYIPQCEGTEQDNAVQSYEDACLQVQLASLYQDLSGVLNLHVAIVGDEAPSKGRVELYYKGKHGSICDYFFANNEAKVVCRMLGYSSGYSQCCGRLGKGEGKMMSGRFRCNGYEESLFACKHGEIDYDEGDCNHENDVGVICN